MDGVNCLKATATSRRQFTIYHSVPRNSWYSFYWPWKDERLSRPWTHPVVLITGQLKGKSWGTVITCIFILLVRTHNSVPYPELFWSWYIGLGFQTKTPELSKVLVSSVSFHHCLLLFILSLKPTGEGLQPQPRSPQTPQLHDSFSPHCTCRKTSTPKNC